MCTLGERNCCSVSVRACGCGCGCGCACCVHVYIWRKCLHHMCVMQTLFYMCNVQLVYTVLGLCTVHVYTLYMKKRCDGVRQAMYMYIHVSSIYAGTCVSSVWIHVCVGVVFCVQYWGQWLGSDDSWGCDWTLWSDCRRWVGTCIFIACIYTCTCILLYTCILLCIY